LASPSSQIALGSLVFTYGELVNSVVQTTLHGCFIINNFLMINVLLSLCPTFDGMVSCGITRRFPISLHRLFLRATNLRIPLKPACTIPCVGRSCIILFFLYSFSSVGLHFQGHFYLLLGILSIFFSVSYV